MKLYESYQEFIRYVTGNTSVKSQHIHADQRNQLLGLAGTNGPPVIVAATGELPHGYPMLEGRHRQPLPRIPGQQTSRNVAVSSNLVAWLVPWRIGAERTMVITVKPGTSLVIDVRLWPCSHDKRARILRRAARVLDATPDVFATAPSIEDAYMRLEKDVWNDWHLEKGDPPGELLAMQARKLRVVLEDLGTRPRAVLRNEHRLLKLQAVRRTDAKTLRWLSAQPGRNIAERAGARQRIKAPKRSETINTLENQVLRAFAALTVRETTSWLEGCGTDARRATIEAHQLRARRVESILRERRVSEAKHPVQPNFALRFDSRYREIWRAWLQLHAMNIVNESQWMWQHRTFMELLGLRAAMKLHEAVGRDNRGGTLSHAPVLKARHPPKQGRYLHDTGILAKFAVATNNRFRIINYGQVDKILPLGAVATAGPEATVWWDAHNAPTDHDGLVGVLPWTPKHEPAWDAKLEDWAAKVVGFNQEAPLDTQTRVRVGYEAERHDRKDHQTGMSRFITVDPNGWLDHLIDENGVARTLGFRSCLYKFHDTWLFGSQALSATRIARVGRFIVDVATSLNCAAGKQTLSLNQRDSLPSALWQLVADATRRTREDSSSGPVHLALVIPDDTYLGGKNTIKNTGKTAIEFLHESFEQLRPQRLIGSRVEFVWRSVAALKAVINQKKLGEDEGAVLVISVNRKTYWTVLKLRYWSKKDQSQSFLCIERSSVMDDCEESEAWTARKVQAVQNAMAAKGISDRDIICRWTRWIEMLATGMNASSLKELGIDINSIEHRSWPKPEGGWKVLSGESPITGQTISVLDDSLPKSLKCRIKSFLKGKKGRKPLAIVVENPAGEEMTAEFKKSIRRLAGNVVDIHIVKATDTVRAAAELAENLARDSETGSPAWLDKVPSIQLEVRKKTQNDSEATDTKWVKIVPGKKAIPAGETYQTEPNGKRCVNLAPGIEHVHLHIRRGGDQMWDERYSGRKTGHTIRPSDHVRIVEPLARLRPLSAEARIKIVEHLPNGEKEILPGSKVGIKWSEMLAEPPDALQSIPDLYIFQSKEDLWEELKVLLGRVVNEACAGNGISFTLKEELYKCTQRQWKDGNFPLGSDGLPPRPTAYSSEKYEDDQRLLKDAIAALLSDLEEGVENNQSFSAWQANRLHMPLTWLFTACPERTVKILLDAIVNLDGSAGRVLHMGNDYSAWSIYSGVGRAVRSEDHLRVIFDTLVEIWKNERSPSQDKFRLPDLSQLL